MAALSLVGALVTGLVLLGRSGSATDSTPKTASLSPPALATEDASPHELTPRHALPADAWAILDLDLKRLAQLGAALPQGLEALDCDRIPPPEHIAVALLAPLRPGEADELQFLVAATGATTAFQTCARQRMVDANARAETWHGGYEVLSRPGGLRLLLHAEEERMVFASASAVGTDELVEVLAGTRPNAARHGHHAELLGSIAPAVPAEPLGELSLTITLPKGWVETLVPPDEAAQSPLRFLRASAWTLRDEGLYGLVDCQATRDGSGCRDLARFLEDARDDLLSYVDVERRPALDAGWSLRAKTPHRLQLAWRVPLDVRARLLEHLVAGAL